MSREQEASRVGARRVAGLVAAILLAGALLAGPAGALRVVDPPEAEADAEEVEEYAREVDPYLDRLGESMSEHADIVAEYVSADIDREEAIERIRAEGQEVLDNYRELQRMDPPESMEDFHETTLEAYDTQLDELRETWRDLLR